MGKVILIGAGPGDPGLMTVKGLYWLGKADVVLYDFLAHPSLLTHCKPTAKCICVGKRKGYHHKTQTQIQSLLKRYATQGLMVVRLKGGDPLLFGRGGEEMTYLDRHKIPYEIVPGVTSASAVPAYAGIPLTHRSLSRSVAIMTGSAHRTGALDDIQIPMADTLVVLMGVTHLEELVDRVLTETHFDEDTPIALIYKGTLAAQKIVVATLGTVANRQYHVQLGTPTLMVIGEVAKSADSPSWVTKLPLWGKRIVLLRSSELAQDWQTELSALGAEVITFPLIVAKKNERILATLTKEKLQHYDEIVLTSPTGAKIFMEAVMATTDARALSKTKLTALGAKTAEILQNFGIKADRVAQTAVAEGVLALLKSEGMKGKKILLPIAADARPVLADGLKALGAKVTVKATYKSVAPNTNFFPVQDGDIVIFTSSSTAKHFYTHPEYDSPDVIACCMGTITAEAVAKYQQDDVLIALKPTLEDMIKLILSV